MDTAKKNVQNNHQEEKVRIKDLLPLLRKNLNDQQLKIIDYTASKFLPLGENYCSIMVKIEITMEKNGKIEKLNLVAKTFILSERPILNWENALKKEVFVYAELIPEYRDMEREMGISENELLDVLPKYYGHRYSLDDSSTVTDNNSLLLMDDLKAREYNMRNRRIGMDAKYAKLALTNLARYHGLGIALKHKRPKFFGKAMAHAEISGLDFSQVEDGYRKLIENVVEISSLLKYRDFIVSCITNASDEKYHKMSAEEPWATITHGDFWVNNILFHENDHGCVDDVKFVDFQLYLYGSPTKDLVYFFFGSLDEVTMIHNFEELLDAYYEAFTETLRRMKCGTEAFSREAFDCELKKQAIRELPMVILSNKVWIAEAQNEKSTSELITNVLESKLSSASITKLDKILNIYDNKGWIENKTV